MAKIRAGDLKHGQRAKYDGGVVIGTGLVDHDGDVVLIDDDLAGRYSLDWADPSEEVELIEPNTEPIDPGEGWRLLENAEMCVRGDEHLSRVGWRPAVISVGSPVRELLRYTGSKAARRRIEPTYRPYTDSEMLDVVGKKVRRKNKTTKHAFLVTIVDDGSTVVGHLPTNAKQLLRDYLFLDGEACGVEDE